MSDVAASKPKSPGLIFFDVNDHGTISEPDVSEPEVNAEVFSSVSSDIKTLAGLINEISSCAPLASYFGQLANEEAESLQEQLDNDIDLTAKQKKAMRALIIELESDPEDDCGWRAWIKAAKLARMSEFKAHIDDWLESPINWDQWELFDQGWSGQDRANNFFESQSREVHDALQIKIIEGDHPGSSYFAAELKLDIETANQVAER